MPEKIKHHVPDMGRKLRRARAIVKKWDSKWSHIYRVNESLESEKIVIEIEHSRYERAAALILAQKLSE